MIDLQKEIVDAPKVRATGEIVERSARLADAFRRHCFPVLLVNVTGGAPGRTDRSRPAGTIGTSDRANLVDELDAQPGDHLATKLRRGAFVLATDAMTDTDPDAHANCMERIFPKLGEAATTAEILDMLATPSAKAPRPPLRPLRTRGRQRSADRDER